MDSKQRDACTCTACGQAHCISAPQLGRLCGRWSRAVELRRAAGGKKDAVLSTAVKLDPASSKPMLEQLRDVLQANAVRVIDLFRSWDEDGNGKVDEKEWRRALAALVLVAPHSSSSSSTGMRDVVLCRRAMGRSVNSIAPSVGGERNAHDCEHALVIGAEAHAGTAAGRDRVLRKPWQRQVFSCGDYFFQCARTRARTHPTPNTACFRHGRVV